MQNCELKKFSFFFEMFFASQVGIVRDFSGLWASARGLRRWNFRIQHAPCVLGRAPILGEEFAGSEKLGLARSAEPLGFCVRGGVFRRFQVCKRSCRTPKVLQNSGGGRGEPSGTKIQPKEEVFGRTSLRTSRQKLRSGPPNPGKTKHFGTDMPRGHPRKNFGLKNFGLIFRS